MLLVDDDRKRLSLVQHALLGSDYELLSASGATEALSIVRALP
ncbi:MAG: CheY-like chemotaxis protein, partial [Candidatus Azotimanducaceae bacterium]